MVAREDVQAGARDRPPASAPIPRLRVIDPVDVAAAAQLLARGFADEPGAVAMFPDLELRERVFAFKTEGVLRAALAYAAASLSRPMVNSSALRCGTHLE